MRIKNITITVMRIGCACLLPLFSSFSRFILLLLSTLSFP